MLVGYNTNIPYKGKVYHVQTEDNGIKNPVIVTLLYFQGCILSSKKISYAHFAAMPDYREKVRELMKEQHKNMIKELIRGKHTDDVPSEPADPVPQTEEPVPQLKSQQEPRPEQHPAPTSSDRQKAQISKSLDDILLEFIMKKNENRESQQ